LANRHAHISDEELLHLFKKDGNNDWLGILLQRYSVLLVGVCMKYLREEEAAKDAVQQVFVKALTELDKQYRIENFGGWLYRIAINFCLNQLRNQKHLVRDYPFSRMPDGEEEEEALHWEKIKDYENLESAISSLKKEQEVTIRMFYYEHKSYQEIAEQTGYSIKMVKSYIQNGKRNLKIKLENNLSGNDHSR